MRYFFAVMRFIVTSIVVVLLVLLLAGCTVGPKYIKPAVPTTPTYKEEAPGTFKESDQWQPGTQQAGRADRRFQPEPKSSGSALPRSSCSDSLQSGLTVSDYLYCAKRQLCQEFGLLAELSVEDPTVQQGRFRAAL